MLDDTFQKSKKTAKHEAVGSPVKVLIYEIMSVLAVYFFFPLQGIKQSKHNILNNREKNVRCPHYFFDLVLL